MAVEKGQDPAVMLKNAIHSCGGLQSLVEDETDRVLIKGNFGCHKPSVTGATTDLRVIVALIEMLQSEGYSNISVGDGGMAGYLKVDLLKYLGVTDLCKKHNVSLVDLNKEEGALVKLRSGVTVRMSKTALESSMINVAKLKTHVLATVTLGIKNLLGTVVGADKREIHLNGLDENLACLPSVIKPRLTIVEGLIGMEGRGPVAGKPKASNLLIASRDVIAADIVSSKLMGFDPYAIAHIKNAIKFSSEPYNWSSIKIVGTPFQEAISHFEPPTPLALEANSYINWSKHAVRATPLYPLATSLLSIKPVAKAFGRLGILQENMDYDLPSQAPTIQQNSCNGCGICKNVCPANAITITKSKAGVSSAKCVKCYCCVETCPRGAIK